MCYKFPGPRCSSHAYEDLKKAEERYLAEQSEEAYDVYIGARNTYDSTPYGQRDLAKEISTAAPEDVPALQARLRRGKWLREDLMKLYRDSQSREALQSVEAQVQIIDERTGSLRFENHSDLGDEIVSVADMQNGVLAQNNCYATARTVSDYLRSAGYETQTVGIYYNGGGEHWASVIKDAHGTSHVIDYTARQFPASVGMKQDKVPFPMVATLDAWTNTVNGWIEAMYGQTPDEVVLSD